MATETQSKLYNNQGLFVAFELARSKWKLALGDSRARRARIATVEPFDRNALLRELARARGKFGLPEDCPVSACMEAGRDGFSVHRWLGDFGIASVVIDPASVEVSRQKRRAKTDRLDAQTLLARLFRYVEGDSGAWRVCHVPSEAAEDFRHLHRDREVLVKERTASRARVQSLLATRGIRVRVSWRGEFDLNALRDPRGNPLGPRLCDRLRREFERLAVVDRQIAEVDAEMQEQLDRGAQADAPRELSQAAALHRVIGVGPVTAYTLVGEFYNWRDFKNRREVGGASGLTGTPYDTGDSKREQGISKAGNHRVRRVAIQVAWSWLRLQPHSATAQWYERKFAEGGKRQRRKGAVALARKLLIDLWRVAEMGVIPEDVRLRSVRVKKSSPSKAA